MKITKASAFQITISAIVLSLCLGSSALAEDADKTDSHTMGGFGVHGGLNFSDYHYANSTYSQATNNTTGALFGIHMEGMTLGLFGLRIEANYSSKGYQIAQIATVTHHYLQIPLLFKISPITGPFELFVEAGPAAALHLSSSTDIANTSVNFNDNSNNWDFSVIAGAGVGFKINPVLLEFEARYDYGLKNLNDSNSVDVKSRALQLIAGVTFLM